MLEYIKGVRKEAGKIVFPTAEEVRRNALIVIGVCAASALVLWGISEAILFVLKNVL